MSKRATYIVVEWFIVGMDGGREEDEGEEGDMRGSHGVCASEWDS